MPQITRPQGTGNEIQSGANISLGVAASSGDGLRAIGEAAVQFASGYESVSRDTLQATFDQAKDYEQQGIEYNNQQKLAIEAKRLYETGRKAENDAVLQNKLSEAYTMFLGHKAVRESQTIDKNGNPTSGTLVSDLNAIGNTLKDKIGNSISDPLVAEAFRVQFDDYLMKQSISAYSKANQQQTEFASKSLDLTLNSLLNQASKDDISQVGTYEQQAVQALNNAVTSGLITSQQRDSQVSEFTTSLREASIEHSIRTDRSQGALITSMSAEKLGITAAKKDYFDSMYNAALEEDERRANKAFEMQTLDKKVEAANFYEDALVKIQAGTFRQEDVVAAKTRLSPEIYKNLERTFLEENGKQQAEMAVMSEMADKVVNGKSMTGYSNKQIDKFYEYTVKKYEDQKGEPATLAEKARLANSLPTTIESYEKELKATTLAGNSAKAKDVLEAYTYLKDTKSKVLNNMDNDATHILEHAEILRSIGGLSAEEAYSQSVNVYKNVDDKTRNTNVKNFMAEEAFSAVDIEETAATALTGGEEALTGLNRVNSETVKAFQKLAASNYAIYGDKDTAIAYAKKKLEVTHGISRVNSYAEYMFAPPELFYGEQFNGATMRDMLIKDVETLVPDGTDIKTIKLTTTPNMVTSAKDPKTGEPLNAPVWFIAYEDEYGEEQILMNPKTMLPRPWSPVPLKAAPTNPTEAPVGIDTAINPITGVPE